jgi:dipeptide/tripeptide permease
LGKFKTIVYGSILYFLGQTILTTTSMVPLGAPNMIGPAFGLIFVAISCGGIKPCIPAYGGDQFDMKDSKNIQIFFSLYVFSINCGSLLSKIINPILRSDVKCFDNDCFPLSFGVSAAYIMVATFFFLIGAPYYKQKDSTTKDSIIIKVVCCVYSAIKNRFSTKEKRYKMNHWLEYADSKYDLNLINDIKIVLRIMVLFSPLPVYWALSDQQGSRWVNQAQQLNGRFGSLFSLKPDQVQALNPLLVMIFVPIYNKFLYPFLAKYGLFKNYLHRMVVGLIFAIAAFFISALLESQMQSAFAHNNNPYDLKILNLSPCNLTVRSNDSTLNSSINSFVSNEPNRPFILPNGIKVDQLELTFSGNCEMVQQNFNQKLVINSKNLPKTLIVSHKNDQVTFDYLNYNFDSYPTGRSEVRFISYDLNKDYRYLNPVLETSSQRISKFDVIEFRNDTPTSKNYKLVDFADYNFKLFHSNETEIESDFLRFESCGRYTILFFNNPIYSNKTEFAVLDDVRPNGLSIAFQFIQIFVLSAGELLYVESSTAFAYSKAPQSMKTIVSSFVILVVAIGNLIVILIAGARITNNQIVEYIIFGCLLTVATIVFMILVYFYQKTDRIIEKNRINREQHNEIEMKVKDALKQKC